MVKSPSFGVDKESRVKHVVYAVTEHQSLHRRNKRDVGRYLAFSLWALLLFGWLYLEENFSTPGVFLMGICVGMVIPNYLVSSFSSIKVIGYAKKHGLKQYPMSLLTLFMNLLILAAVATASLYYVWNYL